MQDARVKEIKGLIEKTIGSYTVRPSLIISEYNRENKTKKDYQGRQIYELIQNADDQYIADNRCEGKIAFEIIDNKLLVKNTGVPFSVDGIESLMNADYSPKNLAKNKRKNTIGQKGLGFRSVLNWCDSLTITTKEFSVQFDKAYAEHQLQCLINDNIEVKKKLRKM